MTELMLDELVKRFADVTAVRGVSLTVDKGNLVALLGPSGCGKTTTLRMIAGLEQPTAGEIRFDGESILGLPPHQRNIGMVFQRYALFPHMNVSANVSFGLRMRGFNKEEIAAKVKEVLEIVQLSGLEKRFPSQLSGGQQQRVAIARTVITSPRVMLMDEPLANLDAKLRNEMRHFITGLQKRLGITTLFVTHDQVEAIELADKIGVMFGGEIVQFGTPEEVFKRPSSPRIADFMGTTNLIGGRLKGKSKDRDGNFMILDGAFGKLKIDHAAGFDLTGEALATIRPEHIAIAAVTDDSKKDSAAPDSNSLTATIKESAYFGGTVTYELSFNNHSLTVSDRSDRRFAKGEEVSVYLAPEHLWVFPETDSS